ncbi:MAG: DUF58 domain-containing protein [Thermodesulfobacteriota bacterium]
MNIRPTISAPLPYLAMAGSLIFGKKKAERRSIQEMLRFPRTLEFTKEGARFIVLLFVIGFAAINTGNNLLYLVVAMMLSLIVISGLMSESTLRDISVKRTAPRRAYKNSPVALMYSVTNNKKRLNSYSFTIEEVLPEGASFAPAYALKLPARKTSEVFSRCAFSKRGVFTLRAVKVKTRFPFGFFLKGRRMDMEEKIIVYPSITPLKITDVFPGDDSRGGSAPEKGEGTQLYGIRDYEPFEDSRRIHWKASAKAGRLLQKEFERERQKKAVIVLENYGDGDEFFEKAVDDAASMAVHFLKLGFEVGLKTLSSGIPCSSGQAHLERLLYALAVIGPEKTKGRASARIRSL